MVCMEGEEIKHNNSLQENKKTNVWEKAVFGW